MSKKKSAATEQNFSVLPRELKFDVLDPHYKTPVKRKDVGPGPIYVLRNMMGPDECARLIDRAEAAGFEPAGLAIGGDEYRNNLKARNNERVMFEDEELAAALWERIAGLTEQKFLNHKIYGLNWRFRIYRYKEGAYFAPHVDERMELGQGLISYFTFMIYLNEGFSGGETTFFERRRPGTASKGKKLEITKVVTPKTGMALSFEHTLFHEGSVVTKGVKYALRSDLIYAPK